VALADGVGKGLLVDDAAAGDVDQPGSLLHAGELGRSDDTAGLVVEGDVDGQESD